VCTGKSSHEELSKKVAQSPLGRTQTRRGNTLAPTPPVAVKRLASAANAWSSLRAHFGKSVAQVE
jgi:hypothetical protein